MNFAGLSTVGLFGGSFDPIHYGHLLAASAVHYALSLDKIVFIPSCAPPHKLNSTSGEHRLKMTELAISGDPRFLVSDVEIANNLTTTIETVRYIRERSKAELFFIVGTDQLPQIAGWRDADELMSTVSFVCAARPGFNADEKHKNKFKKGLFFVYNPQMDISSSNIRKRAYYGEPVNYLLPDTVMAYIDGNGLYRVNPFPYSPLLIEEIDDMLKRTLSLKRYIHSKSVAHEALKLARRFGENEKKAYLAALVHDIAKNLSEQDLTAFIKTHKSVEAFAEKTPELYHCAIGEILAREELGITDPDILNAIKYHTTGRPGMSALEKIIYVADITESTRIYYPGRDKVTAASESDLDKAVCEAVKYKIGFVTEKGSKVHPLSLKLLKEKEAEQ